MPFTGIADGTDGELITWDSLGAPAAVAVGTLGQVLTSNGVGEAPTFQAGGGGSGNTFARVVKKADQSVNNTTTPTDDSELFVALSINKTYSFMLLFMMHIRPTSDLKYQLTVPTGATGNDRGTGDWDATSEITFPSLPSNHSVTVTGEGDFTVANYGRVITGGTAGNLQVQLAQVMATVEDTTSLEGSLLVVWEET